jgi:uncharacterized membrane protein
MLFFKKKFFSAAEEKQIIDAIKLAEHSTSGEIRFYVESKCEGDAYERSVAVFHELKLHEKNHRNGVLIYLAKDHKKFAIIGDEGIHTKVTDIFWENVKDKMAEFFKRGELTQGICEGVRLVGEKLKESFPFDPDNKQGYTDTINHGK